MAPFRGEKNLQSSETIPKEAHTSELLDNNFKVTIWNMLKKLKENTGKELKEIRKTVYEQKIINKSRIIKTIIIAQQIMKLKNTLIEIKNSFEGFNSRVKKAEKRISKLEDRSFEIIESKDTKK